MSDNKKRFKPKHIIPMIAAGLLFIAGAVLLLVGILNTGESNKRFPAADLLRLSENDVGRKFSGETLCERILVEETKNGEFYLLYFEAQNDDDDEYVFVGFDVPNGKVASFKSPEIVGDYARISYCGTVRENDETTQIKIQNSISEYCDMIAEIYENEGMELPESFKQDCLDHISPYHIEIAAAPNTKLLVILGSALAVLAVVLLLTGLFGKKVPVIFGGVVLAALIVFLALNFGKLRTMVSVKKVTDGLYYMDCHYDYDCDKFLDSDISTIDEMIEYIEDELFFGIRLKINSSDLGCSAFTAADENGGRLFGRNFDYDDTDALVIYSEPKNGYASYAVCDLKFFGIGTEDGLDSDSLSAKAVMLAAPYICMDGINEKGVGAGILMLYTDEVHQDNGKPDLLVSAAIRGILDKCSSVDEAIELLSEYDIHSHLNASYHLFITDKTGRTAVVEWSGNETHIVEDTACTNDVMSRDNAFYDPDQSCERYNTLKKTLSENNNALSKKAAMELLAAVKDDSERGTVWSCVYDLNDFSLDICVKMDYENVYSFNKE